ncbi:LysR substrate-binding domain-containing protein [Neorhizobium galegae]|uniref:LysR substrate-binding domain-containing protein n=1 Tax=Neorhizobium galegae TaxID=399 RepID=UPI002103CE50|nr:LysR substrate-binding domain-containing protein [Neorhizobium galegae]MCQ1849983.1 LysR substrate-binding domain-containing protein [Neorhizobium galegae]
MLPVNLDIDILRSFALGLELGSFAKAADRLGRSPSAISLQLKKLEEQVGETLLQKQGRGLVLTEAGEILLSYAKRILELNDEARAAVRGVGKLEGWVKIGVPQDFAETWLPDLLGRFSKIHPKVRVEARVDRGVAMVQAIDKGELDVALTWGTLARPRAEIVARREIAWIGPDGFRHMPGGTLAIVAFDPPCAFRKAAIDALDRGGIPWRHAFASPSLAGLWAAVTAGLGVTPRIVEGKPPQLAALDPKEAGLPDLGAIELALHVAEARLAPPAEELKRLVLEAVAMR